LVPAQPAPLASSATVSTEIIRFVTTQFGASVVPGQGPGTGWRAQVEVLVGEKISTLAAMMSPTLQRPSPSRSCSSGLNEPPQVCGDQGRSTGGFPTEPETTLRHAEKAEVLPESRFVAVAVTTVPGSSRTGD